MSQWNWINIPFNLNILKAYRKVIEWLRLDSADTRMPETIRWMAIQRMQAFLYLYLRRAGLAIFRQSFIDDKAVFRFFRLFIGQSRRLRANPDPSALSADHLDCILGDDTFLQMDNQMINQVPCLNWKLKFIDYFIITFVNVAGIEDDGNAAQRTLFASGFETADELSGSVLRSVPIHLSGLFRQRTADGATQQPVEQRIRPPASGILPHSSPGAEGASASGAERKIHENGGQVIHCRFDQSRRRWRHVSCYSNFLIISDSLKDSLGFFELTVRWWWPVPILHIDTRISTLCWSVWKAIRTPPHFSLPSIIGERYFNQPLHRMIPHSSFFN